MVVVVVVIVVFAVVCGLASIVRLNRVMVLVVASLVDLRVLSKDISRVVRGKVHGVSPVLLPVLLAVL